MSDKDRNCNPNDETCQTYSDAYKEIDAKQREDQDRLGVVISGKGGSKRSKRRRTTRQHKSRRHRRRQNRK